MFFSLFFSALCVLFQDFAPLLTLFLQELEFTLFLIVPELSLLLSFLLLPLDELLERFSLLPLEVLRVLLFIKVLGHLGVLLFLLLGLLFLGL